MKYTTTPVVTVQPYLTASGRSVTDQYFVKETISKSFHFGETEYQVTIPKGFVFDGASIPESLWSLLGTHPASPRIITAAAFHDMIFTPLVMTRKQAREVMDEVMKQHGMSSFKRWIVRSGLFLGGWLTYHFTGTYSTRAIKKMSHQEKQKVLKNIVIRRNTDTTAK